MSFQGVLVTLNNLKKEGIIEDYAVGGGWAARYYDAPILTYDLDVLVVFKSEDSFHNLYEYFRERNHKIEDVYIYIDDMPVQFLPHYISPLYNSAIENAYEIEWKCVTGKIVTVEYLIALLLTAFRQKDIIRVSSLINKAERHSLEDIIKRFDDGKNQLYERYKKVLARA